MVRSTNCILEALEAFIIVQSSFRPLNKIELELMRHACLRGNVFCKIGGMIVYIAHLNLLGEKWKI